VASSEGSPAWRPSCSLTEKTLWILLGRRKLGGAPAPLGPRLRTLLVRTGPFDARTDAFRFVNSFPITEANGQQIRNRFQALISTAVGVTESRFRTPLDDIDLNLSGIGPKIDTPDLIKGQVLQRVVADLIGEPVAQIADAIPGRFGRCGAWHSPDMTSSSKDSPLMNASEPPRRQREC
jgi:hypothetical protein